MGQLQIHALQHDGRDAAAPSLRVVFFSERIEKGKAGSQNWP